MNDDGAPVGRGNQVMESLSEATADSTGGWCSGSTMPAVAEVRVRLPHPENEASHDTPIHDHAVRISPSSTHICHGLARWMCTIGLGHLPHLGEDFDA